MDIEGNGAPMTSMMCVEDPESSRDIISIAQDEGKKPLSITTDTNFEAMSNPDTPLLPACLAVRDLTLNQPRTQKWVHSLHKQQYFIWRF